MICCCRGEGAGLSGGLKNGENKGSLYNPGGIPWQQRTPLWEAKGLLRWNNPPIGQGIADGIELLCDR